MLDKKDWSAAFNLIGKAVITGNSFKMDERSAKSDFIYNRAYIGVDCGQNGTIYCELMGGYSASNRNNAIRVYNRNGDKAEVIEVPWNDRFNDAALSGIAENNFITVELETDGNDKPVTKKFIHAYDAIGYIKSHIRSGMEVSVFGNLKYDEYADVVRVNKEIRRISISRGKQPKAEFTQNILTTKGCYKIDGNVATIDGIVLEYKKTYKGIQVNGYVPLHKEFKYDLSKFDPSMWTRVMDKVVCPDQGVTETKFIGEFITTGITQKVRYEDLDDDIKAMIEIGMISADKIVGKTVAGGGAVVQDMMITGVQTEEVETEFGIKVRAKRIKSKYALEDLAFNKEEEKQPEFDWMNMSGM